MTLNEAARPGLSSLVLQSTRLVLRPLSLAWKEDIFREFTKDITIFMLPDPPSQLSDTESFIRSTMQKMNKGSDLVCVILHQISEEFLGCVGIHHIDTRTPNFGIWIKKTAHGNAYGKEAVTLLKQWVDEYVPYDHILYPVAADNIASRKIPESLGGNVHREYMDFFSSGQERPSVEYKIPRRP